MDGKSGKKGDEPVLVKISDSDDEAQREESKQPILPRPSNVPAATTERDRLVYGLRSAFLGETPASSDPRSTSEKKAEEKKTTGEMLTAAKDSDREKFSRGIPLETNMDEDESERKRFPLRNNNGESLGFSKSPTQTDNLLTVGTPARSRDEYDEDDEDDDDVTTPMDQDRRFAKRGSKGRIKNTNSSVRNFKRIDRTPRKMFVELDELCVDSTGESLEWREKGRWIKFEEAVEEGSDRWGPPHVSSLSFSSLLQLRKYFEKGLVLLDMRATDMQSVAELLIENLSSEIQLKSEEKEELMKVLLLPHRHVSESGDILSHFPDLEVKRSLSGSLNSSFRQRRTSTAASSNSDIPSGRKSSNAAKPDSHRGTPGDSSPATGLAERAKVGRSVSRRESMTLRKIPTGSEATAVLVATVDFLPLPVVVFVRLFRGYPLDKVIEVPLDVRFLAVFIGPPNTQMDYYEMGRSISTLMIDPTFCSVAYKADDRKDFVEAIDGFLQETTLMPGGQFNREVLLPTLKAAQRKMSIKGKPTKTSTEKAALISKEEEADDPLRRTGRPFGGLMKDIRRRYPKYVSDIRDGLNPMCIATIFFMYFACLAPAITFGGLLGSKTDKWMGVSEMLVSSSITGVLFALFSGQPLILVGATGPIMIFETGLYQLCPLMGVDYMSFRLWVGVWVAIVAAVAVAFEASFLVRYCSRFTEEIFAAFVSIIFIYEVFAKLASIFATHPLVSYYPGAEQSPVVLSTFNSTEEYLNESNSFYLSDSNGSNSSVPTKAPGGMSLMQPNTALLSLILCFGTYLIASSLKKFRNGKFLGRGARRAIGDFGIPIAIAVMVAIDFCIRETYTEKLDVPSGLSPTDPSKRGWLISPFGMAGPMPVWSYFAAIIPAILMFILVFVESQITSVIVNKKSRQLQKGSGFHLDLLLIGFFEVLCGFLGLPFVTTGTVRCISHVAALTIYSKTNAPGEAPHIVEVKEQRITGLAVHVLVGLSVFFGPILRKVPLSVLFGVFFYMGMSSLVSIQLYERVLLMFQHVKHYSEVGFVRRVRTFKMHLFTCIQLTCFAVLWMIKMSAAALAFPFFIVLMMPFRLFVISRFFTKKELSELDRGEGGAEESDDEDEQDFYEQARIPS